MGTSENREDVTLLEVLVDAFEKNETLGGWRWRTLPLADEPSAARAFASLAGEARRWKGPPRREVADPPRRLAAWDDLDIRQSGPGVLVRVRAPRFDRWWYDPATWEGDPMGAVFDWIEEEGESPAG